MFTIGAFAMYAGVSIRTLRYWDAEGVLHPAGVDEHSGYRQYRADQLAEANRIRAFQRLGFTLRTIRDLLDLPPDADRMRHMLTAMREQAGIDLATAQERMSRIEAELRIIEGMTTMSHDVTVKTSPAVRLATVSESAGAVDPMKDDVDYGAIFGRLYPELFEHLGRAGVRPAGPTWALYDMGDDDGLLISVAVPVHGSWPGDERVTIVERPELEVAASVLNGRFDNLRSVYQALATWMEANGRKPEGASAEIYLEMSESDPDTNVTEIQIPLA